MVWLYVSIALYWVGFFGSFKPLLRRLVLAYKRTYPTLWGAKHGRGEVISGAIGMSLIWFLVWPGIGIKTWWNSMGFGERLIRSVEEPKNNRKKVS